MGPCVETNISNISISLSELSYRSKKHACLIHLRVFARVASCAGMLHEVDVSSILCNMMLPQLATLAVIRAATNCNASLLRDMLQKKIVARVTGPLRSP